MFIVACFVFYICDFMMFALPARVVIACITCTSYSSEFTELEAVPTSSHLEGPLERGPLASSALPETQDESFERFFVCIFSLCHLL